MTIVLLGLDEASVVLWGYCRVLIGIEEVEIQLKAMISGFLLI